MTMCKGFTVVAGMKHLGQAYLELLLILCHKRKLANILVFI